DLARFGPSYREAVTAALGEQDPEARLRIAARIAGRIFGAERAELDLWRGAGVVSPELAKNEQQHEDMRFASQAPVVDLIVQRKRLRRGLDGNAAREILWAMTSRDLYRMLVVERGWSPERYEQWLGQTLVEALMKS